MRHANQKENVTHWYEEETIIRTDPQMAHTLELSDRDLKLTIKNILKHQGEKVDPRHK